MITQNQAFANIPDGLRQPLIEEYNSIIQNYMERRWEPPELSGGKFCEVVYTILNGHALGTYPATPSKPQNMVAACRSLESNTQVPRSFQILIPRILPALYEIRNNRGVGHIGGDVDPNHMDATAVVSMSSWVMAELARVFHNLDITEAQSLVNSLVERKVPIVWQSGNMRRVLNPELSLKEQIMILIASSSSAVEISDVFIWTGYSRRAYFNRVLRGLRDIRYIEISSDGQSVQILPPGDAYASDLLAKHS
jgi:hypothetical protein